MEKENLIRYKRNQRELRILRKAVENLTEKLDDVPVIQGKVQSSLKEFPFTPMRVSVLMADPYESKRVQVRIAEKLKRMQQIKEEVEDVDAFIEQMPEGIDREIFEMVFQDGKSQKEVGEILGYTQPAVKKRIDKYVSGD